MKVGVICEGPTDFLAISHFLAASLKIRGLKVEFIDIQPEIDATSVNAGGGWSIALSWLQNNPLVARESAYLGAGLFGGGLAAKACDFLIVQIDSDVLDEPSFHAYVNSRSGLTVNCPTDPADRFVAVQSVLLHFCEFPDEDSGLQARHIVAPAVENTETWCVALSGPASRTLRASKRL